MYVLAYRSTLNLGDAIQTYALARLFPDPLHGAYRNNLAAQTFKRDDGSATFLVNGYLCDAAPASGDVSPVFAGVYVGGKKSDQLAWFRRSRHQIGCRDSTTQFLLAAEGLQTELTLCATLTLPPWTGARAGVYNVDAPGAPGARLTNEIPAAMTWMDQWNAAAHRLDLLRRAELVYTARLHVALPCLAFGTPVVFPSRLRPKSFQPQRLITLDDIGFQFDAAVTMDVSSFANRYMSFLGRCLGRHVRPHFDVGQTPIPSVSE